MSKFIGPIKIEFTYYYYLKTKLEYGKITFSMNVPLLKILHNYVRTYVCIIINSSYFVIYFAIDVFIIFILFIKQYVEFYQLIKYDTTK